MATEIITPDMQPPVGLAEVLETTDLRRHTITSKLLGGERQLIVYVPAGYDLEPERRYPVLYLQDGQNLFDPATAYVPGKHWRVDQTAEVLIREGRVEPLIIVGVYHAGEKRVDEYTPTKDSKRKGGKATQYLRTLTEEIKPFIDKTYRTLT
ncbi:MAG TPA: alpha/beta hydrolase-fold protein, partial [Terriglobales bacterium]|nr:alpha/beta hydrolase-fold protein [Terriglobales bacterium]